jgi:hypothetical protein
MDDNHDLIKEADELEEVIKKHESTLAIYMEDSRLKDEAIEDLEF